MSTSQFIINTHNTDLLTKLSVLESKLNYYRRYKKIIDKYNNDSKFKNIIDNYTEHTEIYDKHNFQIFEDTNYALQLMIENKKIQLKNIDDTIKTKQLELININNTNKSS